MTEQTSFYRKVTYLVVIAILLFPLSQLGNPSTRKSEGGKLAQLRDEYNLGQADLGDIDPTSEAMRMATLGARGIAVSLLWNKANEFKKKEDWTNFRATVSQLAKLQPYFISFWRFQSWNLTYNVSVELDDVRDRFHYVKRGIEFLKEGTKYNRESPYLLAELGWFIGNKIGKADERFEYRRMFKKDDDFHTKFFQNNPPPREKRDNWLVSRGQYELAISAVEDKKRSLGQKNPTTFYASPGMSQINYSDAVEREGTFEEKAQEAWRDSAELWQDYGNRRLRSSRGFYIQLASLERLEERAQELEDEFNSIYPNIQDTIRNERISELSPEDQKILATPASDLSEEETDAYYRLTRTLAVSWKDVAKRIAQDIPSESTRARKIAGQLSKLKSRITLTRTNRDVSNYPYWEARCEFEQTLEALKARERAYAAKKAFKEKGDVVGARKLYEESFELWAKVIENYPEIIDDTTTGGDIFEYIEEYSAVLAQFSKSLADEEIDRQFPLWKILEYNDADRDFVEELEAHQRRITTEKQETDSESSPDLE